MSNKTNGVNYSKQKATVERRVRVIARLEKQLKEGVKPALVGDGFDPLEDKDIKRIKTEIETLKQRL